MLNTFVHDSAEDARCIRQPWFVRDDSIGSKERLLRVANRIRKRTIGQRKYNGSRADLVVVLLLYYVLNVCTYIVVPQPSLWFFKTIVEKIKNKTDCSQLIFNTKTVLQTYCSNFDNALSIISYHIVLCTIRNFKRRFTT